LLPEVVTTTLHSKPSYYFHVSHLRNNHSGTVVGEDQELWAADVVKFTLKSRLCLIIYTLFIWFIGTTIKGVTLAGN